MLDSGTEKIRSEIVYTPPKLERIEYFGITYACPKCKDTEKPQFIKDNGKPALIPHSYVSESWLAYILYCKYGLYIPLYRQEKDFLQQAALSEEHPCELEHSIQLDVHTTDVRLLSSRTLKTKVPDDG